MGRADCAQSIVTSIRLHRCRADRIEATTVEVQFSPSDEGTTTVTITQTGFEQLGAAGPTRRKRTGNAWAEFTELYREACRHAAAS